MGRTYAQMYPYRLDVHIDGFLENSTSYQQPDLGLWGHWNAHIRNLETVAMDRGWEVTIHDDRYDPPKLIKRHVNTPIQEVDNE